MSQNFQRINEGMNVPFPTQNYVLNQKKNYQFMSAVFLPNKRTEMTYKLECPENEQFVILWMVLTSYWYVLVHYISLEVKVCNFPTDISWQIWLSVHFCEIKRTSKMWQNCRIWKLLASRCIISCTVKPAESGLIDGEMINIKSHVKKITLCITNLSNPISLVVSLCCKQGLLNTMNLSILNWNVRRIMSPTVCLSEFLSKTNCDIVILSEHKLKQNSLKYFNKYLSVAKFDTLDNTYMSTHGKGSIAI